MEITPAGNIPPEITPLVGYDQEYGLVPVFKKCPAPRVN